MARYSKKDTVSEHSKTDAMAIAKGIQKPAQTKEQTKLVAQGIQKGIELYKKQQKPKARELDKLLKKARQAKVETNTTEEEKEPHTSPKLPWVLLLVSWLGFAVYELTVGNTLGL